MQPIFSEKQPIGQEKLSSNFQKRPLSQDCKGQKKEDLKWKRPVVKRQAEKEFKNRKKNPTNQFQFNENLGILIKLLEQKFLNQLKMNEASIRMKKDETIGAGMGKIRDMIKNKNIGQSVRNSKNLDFNRHMLLGMKSRKGELKSLGVDTEVEKEINDIAVRSFLFIIFT